MGAFNEGSTVYDSKIIHSLSSFLRRPKESSPPEFVETQDILCPQRQRLFPMFTVWYAQAEFSNEFPLPGPSSIETISHQFIYHLVLFILLVRF